LLGKDDEVLSGLTDWMKREQIEGETPYGYWRLLLGAFRLV
jgi:hypothetical protein